MGKEGQEGDRGMMALALALGRGRLWLLWQLLSCLSGVPCHSGGLVGWVPSGLSEPSPPLLSPSKVDGFDWLVGIGWVFWCLCFSGPLSSDLPPPTGLEPCSRITAH